MTRDSKKLCMFLFIFPEYKMPQHIATSLKYILANKNYTKSSNTTFVSAPCLWDEQLIYTQIHSTQYLYL